MVEKETKVEKFCTQCDGMDFDSVPRQNADGSQKWKELVCKKCGGSVIATRVIKSGKEADTPPQTETKPVETKPPENTTEEELSWWY